VLLFFWQNERFITVRIGKFGYLRVLIFLLVLSITHGGIQSGLPASLTSGEWKNMPARYDKRHTRHLRSANSIPSGLMKLLISKPVLKTTESPKQSTSGMPKDLMKLLISKPMLKGTKKSTSTKQSKNRKRVHIISRPMLKGATRIYKESMWRSGKPKRIRKTPKPALKATESPKKQSASGIPKGLMQLLTSKPALKGAKKSTKQSKNPKRVHIISIPILKGTTRIYKESLWRSGKPKRVRKTPKPALKATENPKKQSTTSIPKGLMQLLAPKPMLRRTKKSNTTQLKKPKIVLPASIRQELKQIKWDGVKANANLANIRINSDAMSKPEVPSKTQKRVPASSHVRSGSSIPKGLMMLLSPKPMLNGAKKSSTRQPKKPTKRVVPASIKQELKKLKWNRVKANLGNTIKINSDAMSKPKVPSKSMLKKIHKYCDPYRENDPLKKEHECARESFNYCKYLLTSKNENPKALRHAMKQFDHCDRSNYFNLQLKTEDKDMDIEEFPHDGWHD